MERRAFLAACAAFLAATGADEAEANRLRLKLFGKGGIILPTDPLVARALLLTGTDFSKKGPRATPTKVPGVDPLPAGAYISGTDLIRFNTGSMTAFAGWDFTAFSVYADRGNHSFSDCKFSHATKASLDFRNDVSLTVSWCDFDGQKSAGATTTLASGIKTDANTGTTLFEHCLFHGMGNDALTGTANSTIRYNWFFDGGYNPTSHFDFIQNGVSSNATYSTLQIYENLLDGRVQNAQTLNNAVRLVAQLGGTLQDMLVKRNVVYSPNTQQPPLAIFTNPNDGAAVQRILVDTNWLHFATPNPLYTAAAPLDSNWVDNLDLDLLSALAAPAGWGSARP